VGIIEKIVVTDETLQELQKDARDSGRTVAEEAARRIEGNVTTASRQALIERARKFRASLPPQKTDGLTLLREDRDR
jgi:hypothetical protein